MGNSYAREMLQIHRLYACGHTQKFCKQQYTDVCLMLSASSLCAEALCHVHLLVIKKNEVLLSLHFVVQQESQCYIQYVYTVPWILIM